MTPKALPQEDWSISFSGGRMILSAAYAEFEDGSQYLHHAVFELVANSSNYPVTLDDLKGTHFVTVDDVHSLHTAS